MSDAQDRPLADAAMYARVFEGHHEGVLILEDLIRRFSKAPVLDGGIDGIRKSDHNSGMRAVVEFIVRRINQAHGVPPNDE